MKTDISLIPMRQLKNFTLILSFIGFIAIIWFIWKVPQLQAQNIKDTKDRVTLENATRATLVQAIGGLGLIITAYFAQQNLKVTQEKQVTERFAKAIEQLGNENIHVRLGAIYALERISKDSDSDYWQVMEILTAYVRETSPYSPRDKTENQPPPIAINIQAVLTIIKRRTKSYTQGEENYLNLSKSNLKGADLQGADLKGAYLQGANLQGAYFRGADLRGASFHKADLRGVQLQ